MSDEQIPQVIRDTVNGFAFAAGGANVVMQLSRLPVGHGVARSKVDSGRVDKHPLKRLRTTTAFLAVALLGTEAERRTLRAEINRAHKPVHSEPGDAVQYDAFDPELQLWVAACLYKGAEDIYTLFYGTPDPALIDEVFYPHAKRLGTTLQVKEELWPADHAAFQAYWEEGVAKIEMDDLTRGYLQGVANMSFVVAPLGVFGKPLGWLLRPVGRFLTLGFLPQPFRDELGLPWSERRQRRFDRFIRAAAAISLRLPRFVREFPMNFYFWETRRRIRMGRRIV